MSTKETIKAGSYSRIQIFESCPHRAKLAYIERVKEPERPPLSNGKEYANDRGSRIHDYAEFFVRGEKGHEKLIPELMNFQKELTHLRSIFKTDTSRLVMEDMWLFDNTWKSIPLTSDYKDIWLRIKLDVLHLSPCGNEAIVIDYKTGKRWGNEVKHAEQTQFYALTTFLRYPKVKQVIAELWYTDQDEIATMTFTRKQGMRFLENWNNKMLKLTTATSFPVKANMHSCRFCPFKTGSIGKQGPHGTGHCDRNPT